MPLGKNAGESGSPRSEAAKSDQPKLRKSIWDEMQDLEVEVNQAA